MSSVLVCCLYCQGASLGLGDTGRGFPRKPFQLQTGQIKNMANFGQDFVERHEMKASQVKELHAESLRQRKLLGLLQAIQGQFWGCLSSYTTFFTPHNLYLSVANGGDSIIHRAKAMAPLNSSKLPLQIELKEPQEGTGRGQNKGQMKARGTMCTKEEKDSGKCELADCPFPQQKTHSCRKLARIPIRSWEFRNFWY